MDLEATSSLLPSSAAPLSPLCPSGFPGHTHQTAIYLLCHISQQHTVNSRAHLFASIYSWGWDYGTYLGGSLTVIVLCLLALA